MLLKAKMQLRGLQLHSFFFFYILLDFLVIQTAILLTSQEPQGCMCRHELGMVSPGNLAGTC